MRRTTLTLSLALVVSVVMNVMLWRREPQATPALPAPPVADPHPSPADLPVARDRTDGDLRREVQRLSVELKATQASLAMLRHDQDPKNDSAEIREPEALAFVQIREAVTALLEPREAQGVDDEGNPVKFRKNVLTPDTLRTALALLADYAAIDGPDRDRFMDTGRNAVARYEALRDQQAEDLVTFWKTRDRLKVEEKFEELQRAGDAFDRRSADLEQAWIRESVQPLRTLLDSREAVRPLLLSRHLQELLERLGSADSR